MRFQFLASFAALVIALSMPTFGGDLYRLSIDGTYRVEGINPRGGVFDTFEMDLFFDIEPQLSGDRYVIRELRLLLNSLSESRFALPNGVGEIDGVRLSPSADRLSFESTAQSLAPVAFSLLGPVGVEPELGPLGSSGYMDLEGAYLTMASGFPPDAVDGFMPQPDAFGRIGLFSLLGEFADVPGQAPGTSDSLILTMGSASLSRVPEPTTSALLAVLSAICLRSAKRPSDRG